MTRMQAKDGEAFSPPIYRGDQDEAMRSSALPLPLNCDTGMNRGKRSQAEGSGVVVGSGAAAGGGGNREDYDDDPAGGGGKL